MAHFRRRNRYFPVCTATHGNRADDKRHETLLTNVLLRVGLVIFTAQVVTMLVLDSVYSSIDWKRAALLHASLLTLIAGVVLYVYVIKPLRNQLTSTIEELEQARKKAESSARHDPMTGLLNRRTFFENFQHEWNHSLRYRTPLACIMIDLDGFKQINDRHGHLAGDALLVAVTTILKTHCRASDHLCRYGGEEFCILLPATDEGRAMCCAERIRGAIAEQSVQCEDQVLHVTASFGIAERTELTPDPEGLVRLADRALLRAKQLGRNRVEKAGDMALETLLA